MKKNMKTLLLAGCVLCGFSTPALAQQSDNATRDGAQDDSASTANSDEIVVTARKREESLKDVPASILAIGAQQIDNLNAKSLQDLNGVTPNVRISPEGTLSIRGISSNARNAGFEAGAAVYIDGVYQGRPVGNNQDLSDIARVEILRGPQGTLYGKNTTAGAFSLITVRPGNTWTGHSEIQYGERNDLRIAGYVAGPLATDLVGIKLSGFRRTSDGYQVNLFNGKRLGREDGYGGRAELRFTPGDFDIALRGDYADQRGIGAAAEPVSGPFAAYSPGRDTINYDIQPAGHLRGGGASLTADYDLGGGYSLTSITAWRALKVNVAGDDDFSPLDIIYHVWEDKSDQFTQELRLTSPSTGFLTWIVGGYYFNQTLDTSRPITLGTLSPYPGTGTDDVTVKTDSFAAYANGDLHFTDALTLNLGLRFTSEHKSLDFQQVSYPGNPFPTLNMQDRFTDTDLSPTAALSYKFSPQVTGYAKFSRGYKSGGWNPDITLGGNIAFGPEDVTNYELGLRARTADGAIAFNLTGYYMDYDDLQVAQFFGPLIGNRITNAGKARVKGLEAELQARPANWLTFAAGAAYNDAKFVDFDNGAGKNYAGQQFTLTPKFSGFASLDANVPLSSWISLKGHGDVRYQSRVFFDNDRTVSPVGLYAQDGYALVNARLGVALTNGLEITAFVDNLTNSRALQNRGSDGFGLGLVLDSFNPPRQFGGRVSFHF